MVLKIGINVDRVLIFYEEIVLIVEVFIMRE